MEYKNNVPGIEKYFVLDTKDLFNGIFIFNDTENNIKEERKNKNGLRNGTTLYIDSDGEKIKKEKYKDGVLK